MSFIEFKAFRYLTSFQFQGSLGQCNNAAPRDGFLRTHKSPDLIYYTNNYYSLFFSFFLFSFLLKRLILVNDIMDKKYAKQNQTKLYC